MNRTAKIDPIHHVARLSPAPVLFQFARDDLHVLRERALAFYEAAGEPKQIEGYDAGHGLNEKATQGRVARLCEQLGLTVTLD